MTAASDPTPPGAAAVREGAPARLGWAQLTGRDIRALVWCGEMYGVRADLLVALLGAEVGAIPGVRPVVSSRTVRW